MSNTDLVVMVPALALVLALAALALVLWRSRLPRRPAVIVALRTGESVRGVLVARHSTYIELDRVEVLHGAAGASSTIDGRLQVDRDNVIWVQVL